MQILALFFSLISLVCSILILVHAFQQSVGKGFLCLCVPCYILYYMFAEFQHPQKTLIIAGFFLGAVGNGAINGVRFAEIASHQRQMAP